MSAVRAVAFLLAAGAAVGASADATDDFVRAALLRERIPGCAVAVVRGDDTVKAAGYGIEDLESGVPVSADTYFEIGSITKTFTAQAVMLLVEDGELRLDDPLAKHVDGLPQAWRSLTLRQLLTHTSGLKDWEAAGLLDFRREYTDAEFDALMAPYPLDFAPGTRWGYSNTGYILLGRVVAKVAGMPYDEFVRTRILARLGMDATRFSRPQEIVPHRAGGYVDGGEGLRKGMLLRPRIVEPNGGLLATARELAKWSRSFRAGTLLRSKSLAAMTSPVVLADGSSFPSGFGLFASAFRGHRTWVNNGTTPGGFSAVFYVYPDDALAVHVLCNIDRGDAINRIATRVASFQVHGLDVRSLDAVDDPAPRETKALFAALRAHAAGRRDSRIADSLRLSEDAKKRMATQLARDAMIVRLEADPGSGATTTLRYRIDSAGQRWWYTLTLDEKRRIADLMFEGE